MKREAEQFSEEDKKQKEQVEVINNAESLVYTVEKTLNDAGDKVDQKTKDDIKATITDLKAAIEAKDVEKIKAEMENASKRIQEVGAKMYESQNAETVETGSGAQEEASQAQEGNSGETQSDSKRDENVVDADETK
jgi:molecular chaperone DnaK